jgi:hypothetical protein
MTGYFVGTRPEFDSFAQTLQQALNAASLKALFIEQELQLDPSHEHHALTHGLKNLQDRLARAPEESQVLLIKAVGLDSIMSNLFLPVSHANYASFIRFAHDYDQVVAEATKGVLQDVHSGLVASKQILVAITWVENRELIPSLTASQFKRFLIDTTSIYD